MVPSRSRNSSTKVLAGRSRTSFGVPICWTGAFVDDDDAVGDFKSFLLVMGDEEAGEAGGIVKAAQPMAQFLAHLGIEGPEGFVEQENFRLDSQGTSESHALALSAGELAGKASGELRELDGLEKLLDPGADLGFRRSLASLSHAQTERDVLKDAEMLKERVVLEDKSRAALVRALPRDVPLAEENLSLLRKFESGNDPQESCLARSAGAEQGHQFASLDREVNVV